MWIYFQTNKLKQNQPLKAPWPTKPPHFQEAGISDERQRRAALYTLDTPRVRSPL